MLDMFRQTTGLFNNYNNVSVRNFIEVIIMIYENHSF